MSCLTEISQLCRLCCGNVGCGYDLFIENGDNSPVNVINKYLPIKVYEDASLPRQICKPCKTDVATVVALIDRMIKGQKRLRSAFGNQVNRTSCNKENIDHLKVSAKQQTSPTMEALPSSHEASLNSSEVNGNIIYESQHPIRLAVEGKLKKKKGRPKGRKTIISTTQENSLSLSKPKRKAKLPIRFRDSIVEKEFDELSMEFAKCLQDDDSSLKATGADILEKDLFAEESTHVLEDTTITVTPNLQDESLLKLPATVNIELDFNEKNVTSSNGSIVQIDHTPRASVQMIPKCDLEMEVSLEKQDGILMKAQKQELQRHRKRRFHCSICCRMFSHQGHYTNHLKFHKNVSSVCKSCNVAFAATGLLESHQEAEGHSGIDILEKGDTNGGKEIFKCSICPGRLLISKAAYQKHMKITHAVEEARMYTCCVCNKKFHSERSLQIHENWHKGTPKEERISCEECNRMFGHRTSLSYHRLTAHKAEKKYSCKICKRSFKHRQILQRHYNVHSEERPHTCTICLKCFKTSGNLYNHMNTHTYERVFTCQFCGKQFNHMTSFKFHQRIHSGEKPFECSYCRKTFTQKGNLQEHLRIHTGEKPFCCSECGKSFTASSQLKIHEKRHRIDYKLKCALCHKTFLYEENLQNHQAKHKGLKRALTCLVCNESFSEKASYLRHYRAHIEANTEIGDQSQFKCGTCNKEFVAVALYVKHMMKHWEANQGGAEVNKSPAEANQGAAEVKPFIKTEPEPTTLPLTIEDQSTNQDIIYVLSKNNELEYVAFDYEIFPGDRNQIHTVENLSMSPSIAEIENNFVSQNAEGEEAAFEISIKDPNSLGIIIPEGEDPSGYIKRVLESVIIT